jgi:hypothetical protein
MTSLRAKYIRDLVIRGRSKNTQKAYTRGCTPKPSLVKDYDEALNDQVAEQLAKFVMDAYPANP